MKIIFLILISSASFGQGMSVKDFKSLVGRIEDTSYIQKLLTENGYERINDFSGEEWLSYHPSDSAEAISIWPARRYAFLDSKLDCFDTWLKQILDEGYKLYIAHNYDFGYGAGYTLRGQKLVIQRAHHQPKFNLTYFAAVGQRFY